MRILTIFVALMISYVSFAEAAVIKMSQSGICHGEISPHYQRTQTFTAFSTMEACIDAGVESQRHRERSQTNKLQVSVTNDIILETVGLMRAEIVVIPGQKCWWRITLAY